MVAVLRRDGRGPARPFWILQAVARDVSRQTTLRYPVHLSESAPHGAILFVYDVTTGNEASSEEEESRGRLSFAAVQCKLGRPVRFSASGLLDSEVGKPPIRVSGTFVGVVGPRPDWWPS